MKNPKNTGINGTSVWTEDKNIAIEKFIQEDYAATADLEKLKIRFYAIQMSMQDYIEDEQAEIRTLGYFIQKYFQSFKEFLGIPEYQIIEFLGTDAPNFRKYIKGQRSFSTEMLCRIANLFNADPKLWLAIQNKNELKEISRLKETDQKYSLYNFLIQSKRKTSAAVKKKAKQQ
jgi:plasmid maintenance system antidote protein VapI